MRGYLGSKSLIEIDLYYNPHHKVNRTTTQLHIFSLFLSASQERYYSFYILVFI